MRAVELFASRRVCSTCFGGATALYTSLVLQYIEIENMRTLRVLFLRKSLVYKWL